MKIDSFTYVFEGFQRLNVISNVEPIKSKHQKKKMKDTGRNARKKNPENVEAVQERYAPFLCPKRKTDKYLFT